jgi:hypothetical protein
VHFVRTSDTLQSIALSYGLSVEDFCKMNDLKPGANSLAGKTLVKVPDTSGPSKPAIEGARLNLYVLAHNVATVLSRIDACARTARDCRFAMNLKSSLRHERLILIHSGNQNDTPCRRTTCG